MRGLSWQSCRVAYVRVGLGLVGETVFACAVGLGVLVESAAGRCAWLAKRA